ncbi:MAG: hypothetical protein DHS20C10_02340 [marine bacterium B5-7]|nr:MAG: hypothetical protein DHS20C10_02340 [marine bacterium B5-7]
MMHGQWHTALHIYGWPLYSACIAFVAQLLHLPVVPAAHSIDALFDIITLLSAIAIIHRTTHNRQLMWLTALIFLVFPFFNHFRADIMRGHGYCAFGILAFYYLIKTMEKPHWRWAVAWQCCMGLAMLFRIEGIVFLLLMPVSLLFWVQNQSKLSWLSKQYSLLLFAVMALLLSYPFTKHWLHLSRFTDITFQFSHGIQKTLAIYHSKINALAEHVMMYHPHVNAIPMFWFGLLGIYVTAILKLFGLALLALFGLTYWKNPRKPSSVLSQVLLSVAVINSLFGLFVVAQYLFLSQRYIILMALTILLVIPFGLQRLLSHEKSWVRYATIGLIFYMAAASIGHFGRSKTYVIDAAQWLKQHYPTSHIFVNSQELAQTLEGSKPELPSSYPQVGSIDALQQSLSQTQQSIKIFAFKLEAKQKALQDFVQKHMKRNPDKQFCNKRHDCVWVYVGHEAKKLR